MRPVVLLPGLVLACTLHGDGQSGEQSRELPFFDVVEVFDDFTVALAVDPGLPAGEKIRVEVRGDANALDRLFTQVHAEDTLAVNVDPNHLTQLSLVPELRARVPGLTRVYATDASVLEVSGAREALALELHGSAALTLRDAQALTLDVVAADAAALTLVGSGPALALATSGAATVDARGFAAETVTVDAQGSGEVRVCSASAAKIDGPGAEHVVLDCG